MQHVSRPANPKAEISTWKCGGCSDVFGDLSMLKQGDLREKNIDWDGKNSAPLYRCQNLYERSLSFTPLQQKL